MDPPGVMQFLLDRIFLVVKSKHVTKDIFVRVKMLPKQHVNQGDTPRLKSRFLASIVHPENLLQTMVLLNAMNAAMIRFNQVLMLPNAFKSK